MKMKPCCWCLYQGQCAREDDYNHLLRTYREIAKDINVSNKASGGRDKKLNAPLILTTMGVTCTKYYEQLKPGDRVEFRFYSSDDDGSVYWSEEMEYGTFIGWKKRQAIIWLDDEIYIFPDGNGRQKIVIHPKNHRSGRQRIVKTGKTVNVCPECGIPEGQENDPGWYCETCEKLKEEK